MPDMVPSCPYVGLQPYTEADRDYFFGRERDKRIIAANMHATPLTVLYGASGVGKSSILLAGVVPELRAQSYTAVAVFREWQRQDFLAVLKQRLVEAVRVATRSAVTDVDPGLPLDELLARATAAVGGPVFLVFDQFEEYFLYHPAADSEQPFESELARIVNRSELDASVLVALREDELARLDRFRVRIPNLLGNTLRLRHLDQKAAEDAIRKPLEVYNRRVAADAAVTVEGALVAAVLQQVRSGQVSLGGSGGTGRGQVADEAAIETPFLQLVLTRLWEEERAKQSRSLRLSTLTRLGGAREIARTHLDEIMKHLDLNSHEVCARCFDRFVTPSGTKIACRVEDLAAWARDLGPSVRRVMMTLADNRIVRAVTTPGGEQSYEIFHDVLAPAVLDWRNRYVLDRERAEAERRTATEAAAREREAIRDQELVQAQALAAEQQRRAEAERERAEERRQRLEQQVRATRRQWVMITALVIAVLFALIQWRRADGQAKRANIEATRANQQAMLASAGAAGASQEAGKARDAQKRSEAAERQATDAKQEADKLRDMARRDARAAFSRELAAVAMGSLDVDPERSLILSLHALHRTKTADPGEQNLLTELQGPMNRALQAVRAIRFRPSVIDLPGRSMSAVAVSPDGRRLATAADDGVVIWDATSGDVLWNLRDHRGAVSDVAFGPDGTWLVAVGADGAIIVWDAQSGRVRTRQDSASAEKSSEGLRPLHRVGVSPDGATFATAGAAGMQVWSLMSGPEGGPASIKPHGAFGPTSLATQTGRRTTSAVSAVAFSPDGRFFAANTDGKVTVFELSPTRPGPRNLPSVAGLKQAAGLAFSLDSTRIATGGEDGWVTVFDRSTGQPLMRFEHGGPVAGVAFRPPDGRQIVTVGRDKFARLWDVVSGQPLLPAFAHETEVLGVAFSRDGRRLVTVERGAARVWDLPFTHVAPVTSAALSSDGRKLATGDAAGTVKVWDTVSGYELLALPAHAMRVRWVAFSGNDRVVATAGLEGVVKVWEVATGLDLGTVESGEEFFTVAVAVSRDGDRVATGEGRGAVRIWDVRAGGTEIGRVTHESRPPTRVSGLTLSPDGRRLASIGADGTVHVWDTQPLQRVSTLAQGSTRVVTVAFDPAGRRLATAGSDRIVRVWDVSDSVGRHVFERPEPAVVALAFSPDGKRLLLATRTGEVRELDEAGRELRTVAGQTRSLIDARFSLNGRHAVMLESGGSVRLVALDVDDMIRFALYQVERGLTGKECAQLLRMGREECPPQIQALQQFADGRRLAMQGEVAPALERFRGASRLHPSGMGAPEEVARSLTSMHLMAEGRRLALRGDTDQAAAIFRRAAAVDIGLGVDPQATARRLWARRLLSRAGRFAREGDAEEVRTLVRQARQFDVRLPESVGDALLRIASARHIDLAIEHMTAGRFEAAVAEYRKAMAAASNVEYLGVGHEDWNNLCWFFAVRGEAALLAPGCELAGRLAEKDWRVRDTRGLVRALTGNVQGAIEDFQFVVDERKSEQDFRAQRQRWLDALRAGRNPFTPEELKTLEEQ